MPYNEGPAAVFRDQIPRAGCVQQLDLIRFIRLIDAARLLREDKAVEEMGEEQNQDCNTHPVVVSAQRVVDPPQVLAGTLFAIALPYTKAWRDRLQTSATDFSIA